jgi:hypothetical protein
MQIRILLHSDTRSQTMFRRSSRIAIRCIKVLRNCYARFSELWMHKGMIIGMRLPFPNRKLLRRRESAGSNPKEAANSTVTHPQDPRSFRPLSTGTWPCTAVAPLSNSITSRISTTAARVPRCRYMIWGANWYGLGNRLITLTSAFIYAILSQRVLLIDYPAWGLLFCDPFQGHSPSLIPPERP